MGNETQERPPEDSEQRHGNGGKNSQPAFGIQNPPGQLKVIRLKDGRRLVARDLIYRVDAKTAITVKKGFKTDYSSDPIGLLDWSQADIAGVVHDYLYQHPAKSRTSRPVHKKTGSGSRSPHMAHGGSVHCALTWATWASGFSVVCTGKATPRHLPSASHYCSFWELPGHFGRPASPVVRCLRQRSVFFWRWWASS